MARRQTTTGNLTRLLGAGSVPLFIVNAQRKVLAFNRGCEELTGWSAEEVVGQVCHYGSGGATPLEQLTAGLCPPPEVFSGAQKSVPAYLVAKDKSSLPRMINFYPFKDDSGEVSHILGVATLIPVPPVATDATTVQNLHAELAALRATLRTRFGRHTLIGRSPSMERPLNQVELAGQCEASVFLLGDPGTGKEHTARVIHYDSELKNTAFVSLDCRILAPSEIDRTITRLLDSATDPASRGLGIPAGSLFLGHVEHLARDAQRRIVNAFAEREPFRLRLFASSMVSPETAIEEELLLFELASLLRTITIELPPLSARREDAPVLAQHFLEEQNRLGEKQIGGFAPEVAELIAEYNWPGNLRELSQVVSEAHAAATGDLITTADLPFRFRTGFDAQQLPPPEPLPNLPLEQLTADYETELIQRALKQCKQNKSKAAELLQINRAKLYRRMEILGIDDGDEPEED